MKTAGTFCHEDMTLYHQDCRHVLPCRHDAVPSRLQARFAMKTRRSTIRLQARFAMKTRCCPAKTAETYCHEEDTLFHKERTSAVPRIDADQSHLATAIGPKRRYKGTWVPLRTPKCLKKQSLTWQIFYNFETFKKFYAFCDVCEKLKRNKKFSKFGRLHVEVCLFERYLK